MSKLQKILLLVLILALIILIILTWGSIGSIAVLFGLVMIGPVYLINRFINTDQDSDFTNDNNG